MALRNPKPHPPYRNPTHPSSDRYQNKEQPVTYVSERKYKYPFYFAILLILAVSLTCAGIQSRQQDEIDRLKAELAKSPNNALTQAKVKECTNDPRCEFYDARWGKWVWKEGLSPGNQIHTEREGQPIPKENMHKFYDGDINAAPKE